MRRLLSIACLFALVAGCSDSMMTEANLEDAKASEIESAEMAMKKGDSKKSGKSNKSEKSGKSEKSVKGEKVELCHFPPGNPGNAKVISVDSKAAMKHLSQHEGDGFVGGPGDYLDEEASLLYDANCDPLPPPPVECPLPDFSVANLQAFLSGSTWINANEVLLGSHASGTRIAQVLLVSNGNNARNLWLRFHPSGVGNLWGHPPKGGQGITQFLWGALLNWTSTVSNQILVPTGGLSSMLARKAGNGTTQTIPTTVHDGDDAQYEAEYLACRANVLEASGL